MNNACFEPLDTTTLAEPMVSHMSRALSGGAPVVAATDYVRAYPEMIAAHLSAPYIALGTDGFGRSDTRAALRDFFEVDRRHIAVAALSTLVDAGQVQRSVLAQALAALGIDTERTAPWTL